MLRTLGYIFSAVLLVFQIQVNAQNDNRHAITLGADLSRFVLPLVDNTRYGWEVSGSYDILNDLSGRVEFGSQSTSFSESGYDYSSTGVYTRFGVDYNYMKHIDPGSSDKMLIGARYGFTTFYHEADNITLEIPAWGSLENQSIDRKWISANWLEISTGMNTHLINNFYLGWSVRFRIKIWEQNDPHLQPYYIPGYGRAWNSSWVGFNYSLYYRIPFARRKSTENDK